jgi:ABC-type branched-subunit amino acid transport system substrate-binding protein
MRRKFAALAVTLIGALGVAATGSAATSHKSPHGSTVNLMAIGPINAPEFSLPSIPVGAQVAINQINKAGGLNGHRLKLITCNDENNPNTATACAREAIADKVVAVVGGLSIFDTKIIPYLTQAGIPWIGESTPDSFTAKNLFWIGDDGLSGYLAIGQALASQGCKKVAIVISAEGTPISGQQMADGAKAGGAQVVNVTQAPATSPNWTSIVAADRAAGADCIGGGTGPSETPGLLAAINSGTKFKHVVLLEGGLPDAEAAQLGSSINGVEVVSAYYPQTVPAVKRLAQAAKKLAPSVTFDAFTEHGYVSVITAARAARKEGSKTVTAKTVTAGLNKLSGYNTGFGPIVNFTNPPITKTFPRVVNPYYFIWYASDGKMLLKSKTPINVTKALKLLGKTSA